MDFSKREIATGADPMLSRRAPREDLVPDVGRARFDALEQPAPRWGSDSGCDRTHISSSYSSGSVFSTSPSGDGPNLSPLRGTAARQCALSVRPFAGNCARNFPSLRAPCSTEAHQSVSVGIGRHPPPAAARPGAHPASVLLRWLALGATPVAARVVGDPVESASFATKHMATQRRATPLFDGRHDLELVQVLLASVRTVGSEDVGDLQGHKFDLSLTVVSFAPRAHP